MARNRKFDIAVTICYAVVVLVITLGTRLYDPENKIALNPFHEYAMIIRIFQTGFESGGIGRGLRRLWIYRHVIETIILNVLLFVPLGYLLPQCQNQMDSKWKIILVGFLCSLGIECTQLVTRLGWFDASDLLHNSLGALIGWKYYQRILKEK
ncbi:MAG: VanZ family protein [Anaerolineaceae bacterium]|nr:VanZ family protein [Anaerolineaceae bacterium]